MREVQFNPEVKLFLADVDETVADVYTPATPEMITELTTLLEEGRSIFFVSGTSFARIKQRVIDSIPQPLRRGILVSHCSGAEVWGYDEAGNLRAEPFYSLYDATLDEAQKTKWREIVQQLITEFQLEPHNATNVKEFKEKVGDNPLAIMLDDRGPQITFEFVNGYDLTPEQEAALEVSVPQTHGALDLRIPVLERTDQLLQAANIPITPRLGGIFALDLALKGVSKTESIKHLLENDHVLHSIGLSRQELENPEYLEIWGDRFDRFRGGTDRHMQEAVSPDVRAIDFREENPEGFMQGYNTVLWDGSKHLHDGLLEYLQSRHRGA